MVNFVEAIQYKISCAVAELDGRPKPVDSRYAPYLERSKDKLVRYGVLKKDFEVIRRLCSLMYIDRSCFGCY